MADCLHCQTGRCPCPESQSDKSNRPVAADGAALESSGLHAQCRRNSPGESGRVIEFIPMSPVARCSKQIRRRFALGASLLLIGAVLPAAEKISLPPETSGFRPGPGAEIAVAQCLLCHSADYVSTQ